MACALSRMARQPRVPRVPDADREPGIVSYTDGAWDPDDHLFEAGAAVVELELVKTSPE